MLGKSGLAPWLSDLQVNAKGFGRTADLAVATSNDFELAAWFNGQVIRYVSKSSFNVHIVYFLLARPTITY